MNKKWLFGFYTYKEEDSAAEELVGVADAYEKTFISPVSMIRMAPHDDLPLLLLLYVEDTDSLDVGAVVNFLISLGYEELVAESIKHENMYATCIDDVGRDVRQVTRNSSAEGPAC